MKLKSIPVFLFVLSIVLIGCRGGEMEQKQQDIKSINDISDSQWEALSQKKIFFGHQSIGFDIVKGIKDLMKEDPSIRLNIVQTSDPNEFKTGVFAHTSVGQNINPGLKIRDFKKIIEGGLGNKADIAFFKFCFLDINSGTDLSSIFNDYKNTMTDLSKKYPKTSFFHMTTPLTLKVSGIEGLITNIKDFIKKIIGKMNMYDNTIKYEFNKMFRKAYDQDNLLFDLAMYESTTADGNLVSYKKGKNTYYTLLPEYTDDGAHLNKIGRRKVAEQLLIFCANHIGTKNSF